MIRFACPICRKVIKAPDHGAGQKFPCPKCGQRLQIPFPIQKKTVLGEILPGAVPAAPAKTVDTTCPGCGRIIPLAPDELTMSIECARCSTRFVRAEPTTVSHASPLADEGKPLDDHHVYKPRRRWLGGVVVLAVLLEALSYGAWVLYSAHLATVGPPARQGLRNGQCANGLGWRAVAVRDAITQIVLAHLVRPRMTED